MLTLILPIKYYPRNERGQSDITKNLRYEDAILTLKSIPALSQDDKKPIFGRWLSTSVFLGNELEGDYYVTRIKSWDDQRFWPVLDNRLQNPVGRFFDSRGNFLDLYGFGPNEFQTTWGYCRLSTPHEGVFGEVWKNASAQRPR